MKKRMVVSGLVAIAVLGAWFFVLWGPQRHALEAARATERSRQATHLQLRAELFGLLTAQRQLPAERAALLAAAAAVPTSPSVATLLDQIAGAANRTGVTWSNESQTLATPSATSGPPSLALSLVVSGSTAHVAAFVSALQHLPRLVVVSAVANAAQGAAVTAQVTATAIYDEAPLPVLPAAHART